MSRIPVSFDQAKEVLHPWVLGRCFDYCAATGAVSTEPNKFLPFALRTLEVVVRAMREGPQVLTGACSDFECTISIDARRLFGPLFR